MSRPARTSLPRPRRAAAIGIALVAALGAVIAASVPSQAASSSTVVGATVPAATNLSIAGCPTLTANVTDFGVVQPGSSNVTTADCSVVFGSSNSTSMLRLFQDDGGGSGMWRPTNGSYDTSFSGDGVVSDPTEGILWDPGYAVEVDQQGRIVVAGDSEGAEKGYVLRYTAAGVLDATFDGDGRVYTDWGSNDQFFGMALQPDGKIVTVGGSILSVDYDSTVHRFNVDGSLDTSFGGGDGWVDIDGNPGDSDYLNDVAIMSDGSIVAVGNTSSVRDVLTVRLTAAGVLDPTWDGDGIRRHNVLGDDDTGTSLVVLADGRVVVTGQVKTGGNGRVLAVRYTSSGALDTTFDGDGVAVLATADAWSSGTDLSARVGGGYVISGWTGVNPSYNGFVMKVTAAGALDTSYSGDGISTAPFGADLWPGNSSSYDHVVLSDDRIVIAGVSGLSNDWRIVRLAADGSLDTSFGTGGMVTHDFLGADDHVFDITALRDGSLAMSGRGGAGYPLQVLVMNGLRVADYGSAVDDWDTAAPNDDSFGACLRSVSGAGVSGAWTVDGNATCTASDTDPWNAIAATTAAGGAKVAQSTTDGTTNATANLRFGFRTASGQPAGRYVAPVTFEVIAPNA